MEAVPLEKTAVEQAAPTLSDTDISIEELVREDNWRAVLVELIVSNKLDPWNIDIERLASSFLAKLEDLTREGFDVPANLVLACAIVVKFKSLALDFKPEESLPSVDEDTLLPTEAEVSTVRLNPRMPITIHEIVKAVEKTLEKIKTPPRRRQRVEVKEVSIEIDEEENIEKEVKALYARLAKVRRTLFSKLVESDEKTARTLLSLLFLTNEEKIRLRQERLFEDIEVEVLAEASH